MIATDAKIENHQVFSREEWLEARKAHLLREKELSRRRDELCRERRALPWVNVDKEYLFDGPGGEETLAHTYSSYARGGDILIGVHNFLDLTPKGRNEKSTMDWMRHHDKYEPL